MPQIWTFSYRDLRTAQDLRDLLPAEVSVVADVRWQRGLGDSYFSEVLVEDTVRRAGRRYAWNRGWGNPDYKEPGSRFPSSKPATRIADWSSLEVLRKMIDDGDRIAMMCVCPNAMKCHRRLIIEDLLRTVPGLEVIEL